MSDLQNRDEAVIWHPFTPLIGRESPLVVKSAQGVYLHTEDGRKILDGISSWWVNLHGHSHPRIAEAVARQAETLEHVIFAGFTHESAIKLAEGLLKILPEGQSKIFYSDNGSTAVEVALKMAFQYWHNLGIKKTRIIALEGAYHGDTFGAMSVGQRGAFIAPFAPFLFDVEFVPFPFAGEEEKTLLQFDALLNQDDVAAFIFEPLLQGSAGMRMYAPDTLNKLVEKAKKKQVLCIADEVMTGFGRTGKLFATDYIQQKPDIFCLSKGLTGGTMAMGATSCTEEIIDAFRSSDVMKTFFHGHSFTANPLACAASLASLEILLEPECIENRQRIATKQAAFKEKLQGHPKLKKIRALGTVLAMELVTQEGTSYFNSASKNIYGFFMNRNILLRPLGNVIYILPPYVISDGELEAIYLAIEEFLNQW